MPGFKLYIVALMKDRRNSPLDVLVKGILRVFSWIYGIAVSFVDWTYASGVRRQDKASVPVVSVGNLTLGGTGKTPFTVYLADHYLSAGKKPAILIRGYGNDENRMLHDELPEVPVFSGQDRLASAGMAAAEGRDVLILDDGFQHRRIQRDLNILLLDSVALFGNGAIFPRGVLREPVASIKRADILVLTKVDMIDSARKETIVKDLKALAPEKPVVTAKHKASFLTDVTGAAYPAESLKGSKVFLVSGIVDPDYFEFLVKNAQASVAARRDYADHHRYSQKDVNAIYNECLDKGFEKIIVTKKDFVKMKDLDISSIEDKLFILNIVIDIIEGKERLVAGLNSIFTG